ncbi:MAG: hypothetical protein V8Q55_02675 [Christensenellales bacterium]
MVKIVEHGLTVESIKWADLSMAKKKKRVAKNEFRFNENQHHMTYVFEDDGKKYSSFGITHQKRTFDRENMPLKDNPQKRRTDKAYLRNGVIRDKHGSYGKVKKNFAFSSEDYTNVKAKIRNYKKKRKKNK